MADIRIKTTKERRKRIKKTCAEEEMTYEELFIELLDFREDNPEAWQARGDGTRRASGSGNV